MTNKPIRSTISIISLIAYFGMNLGSLLYTNEKLVGNIFYEWNKPKIEHQLEGGQYDYWGNHLHYPQDEKISNLEIIANFLSIPGRELAYWIND